MPTCLFYPFFLPSLLHFTLFSHLSPFSPNHPSRKYHAKFLLYCLTFYMRQNMLRQGHSQVTSAFACLPAAVLPRWWWRSFLVRQDRDIKFFGASHNHKDRQSEMEGSLRRLVDACISLIWEAFSQEKELSPSLEVGVEQPRIQICISSSAHDTDIEYGFNLFW